MVTVAQEIDADAPNPLVRLAMRLGALLEGGSLGAGPFPTGDQGTSPGPFQIHLPAHPGVTVAQAQDPAFAVKFMLPSYTAAAAHIPASVAQSNPELAAEQIAFHAERPARDYFASRGQSTVDNAWKIASGAAPSPGAAQLAAASGSGNASSATSTTDTPPGGCKSPTSGAEFLNPLTWGSTVNPGAWVGYFFCKLEADAKPALFETAAVIAGAGLVVAGLVKTVSRSQTFKAAKAAAGNASAKGAEIGAVA